MGLSSRMILFYLFLRHIQKRQIRVSDLAQIIQTSKPNVSQLINQLSLAGYIRHTRYGSTDLTESGIVFAQKLYYRILVLESFLFKTLSLPHFQARSESFSWEQNIYDHTFNIIDAKMRLSVGLSGESLFNKSIETQHLTKLQMGNVGVVVAFQTIGLVNEHFLPLLASIYLEKVVIIANDLSTGTTLSVNNQTIFIPVAIAEQTLVTIN
ncbi:MAG TPA: hypothetical protein PK990_00775 [Salinivirgaceae bacterium]|nr:hypothetical protein [Salinivirgaceae bacterium]